MYAFAFGVLKIVRASCSRISRNPRTFRRRVIFQFYNTHPPSVPKRGPSSYIALSNQNMAHQKKSTPSMHDDEITHLLHHAVTELKHDFQSGARQMASSALSILSTILETAAHTAKTKDELWHTAVSTAKALSNARPSMNAAVTSCLLRALEAIHRSWEAEEKDKDDDIAHLASVARHEIQAALDGRRHTGEKLEEHFEMFVMQRARELNNKITIVTLSNSSTIRACITRIASVPNLSLTLHILESRPRCEGADMAAQILSSLPHSSRSHVHICIFPDCAVGPAVRHAQFALLGADRIAATGEVSNKIGSLSIAAVARRSAETRVVVVSDVDKVVAPGLGAGEKEVEVHPPGEMMGAWAEESRGALEGHLEEGRVEVFGEWFEWVPAEYIDVYVTENGELTRSDVEEFGHRIGVLKRRIFGAETVEG